MDIVHPEIWNIRVGAMIQEIELTKILKTHIQYYTNNKKYANAKRLDGCK